MRIAIACCAAALMSALLASAPASAATKVYLLAGQSNMMGQGALVSGLPSPYSAPQPDVKFWNNNQWVALRGGFGVTSNEFGPEVSFGYKIHSTYPGDDIYLVKYAVGATTLAGDWNPNNGSGWCYNNFKATVNAALLNLSNDGLSPTLAGMLWMQGESDALVSGYATNYQANLTNFITKVRGDFNAPNMNFVLGRIVTYWGTASNNALVRTAQQTVPGLVGHASWVDTDDLQIGSVVGHYGTAGQIELGVRFAASVVPEPGTMVLLATGLFGLLAYAWWKRRGLVD